jgi:surface protein
MKSLKQHIYEKLILNKNIKVKEYNFHPKTRDELKDLVDRLIKERGNEADLNDIDTSEITDMSKLFIGWTRTANPFNGDISEWDVSNVKTMKSMFFHAEFNGDISKWDVSNVEDMEDMFYMAKRFNQDISKWDVSNVKKTTKMFWKCKINRKFKPKFNK